MLTAKSFAAFDTSVIDRFEESNKQMVDMQQSLLQNTSTDDNNTVDLNYNTNDDNNDDQRRRLMLKQQLSALNHDDTNHRCLSCIVSSPTWIWTLIQWTAVILCGLQYMNPNGVRTGLLMGYWIVKLVYDIAIDKRKNTIKCITVIVFIIPKLILLFVWQYYGYIMVILWWQYYVYIVTLCWIIAFVAPGLCFKVNRLYLLRELRPQIKACYNCMQFLNIKCGNTCVIKCTTCLKICVVRAFGDIQKARLVDDIDGGSLRRWNGIINKLPYDYLETEHPQQSIKVITNLVPHSKYMSDEQQRHVQQYTQRNDCCKNGCCCRGNYRTGVRDLNVKDPSDETPNDCEAKEEERAPANETPNDCVIDCEPNEGEREEKRPDNAQDDCELHPEETRDGVEAVEDDADVCESQEEETKDGVEALEYDNDEIKHNEAEEKDSEVINTIDECFDDQKVYVNDVDYEESVDPNECKCVEDEDDEICDEIENVSSGDGKKKTKDDIEKELTYLFRWKHPKVFEFIEMALQAIAGISNVKVFAKGGSFGGIKWIEKALGQDQLGFLQTFWKMGDIDCEIIVENMDPTVINGMVSSIETLLKDIDQYLEQDFTGGIKLDGETYTLSEKRSNVQWISNGGDRVAKYYSIKERLLCCGINNLQFPSDGEKKGNNHFNIFRIKLAVKGSNGSKYLIELLDICKSYKDDHKHSKYNAKDGTYKEINGIWTPTLATQAAEFERMAKETGNPKYVERGGLFRFWMELPYHDQNQIRRDGWDSVLGIGQCETCKSHYVVKLVDPSDANSKSRDYCTKYHKYTVKPQTQ